MAHHKVEKIRVVNDTFSHLEFPKSPESVRMNLVPMCWYSKIVGHSRPRLLSQNNYPLMNRRDSHRRSHGISSDTPNREAMITNQLFIQLAVRSERGDSSSSFSP